jgi:hypothetical protein
MRQSSSLVGSARQVCCCVVYSMLLSHQLRSISKTQQRYHEGGLYKYQTPAGAARQQGQQLTLRGHVSQLTGRNKTRVITCSGVCFRAEESGCWDIIIMMSMNSACAG